MCIAKSLLMGEVIISIWPSHSVSESLNIWHTFSVPCRMTPSFSAQKFIKLLVFSVIQKQVYSLFSRHLLSSVTMKIHKDAFQLLWLDLGDLHGPFPALLWSLPPGTSPVTALLTLFQFLRHLFLSPTHPCACLDHHSYSTLSPFLWTKSNHLSAPA